MEDCTADLDQHKRNATGNVSNVHEDSWFYDEGWNWFMRNIFVWLFPLMCLIGAIANICSFIVIAKNRKSFPYVTRQYLLIITMSDFFTLTVPAFNHYVIYMTSFVKQNNWSWYLNLMSRHCGFGCCIAYNIMTCYLTFGSEFFQLGLTVDRLVAVAAPMRAKMILSHKRSWILLAIISGMALLLPIVYAANLKWDDENKFCNIRSKKFLYLFPLVLLFYGRVFLITLLLLGTIAICVLLGRSNRAAGMIQADAGAAGVQEQNLRERRKNLVRISVMLIFFNVLFLFTSLPWSIAVFLYFRLLKSCQFSPLLVGMIVFFSTLVYVNNALGWPVYFLGHKFRQAFYKTFVPICLRRAGGRNDRAAAAAAAGRLIHRGRQEPGKVKVTFISPSSLSLSATGRSPDAAT